MLQGLGPRAVVGGHHEEHGVDLACPDEHVANQPIVAGDVHEIEHVAIREGQVRIPDLDRHPAATLLGQPIGVDPRERPEQRRLAVVDVARRPDDDGHPRGSAVPRAEATLRPSSTSAAGSTVRRSTTTRPPSIRPTTAGSPSRRRPRAGRGHAGPRVEREPKGRQRLARQRATAEGCRQRDGPRPVHPGCQGVGASAQRLDRCCDHPPDRDLGSRPPSPVEAQRGRDSGQRHLVWPHRPSQGVLPKSRDQVGPPDDQPGLRPPDELVTREDDQVSTVGEAFGRRRLVSEPELGGVEQGAGSEVVHQQGTVGMGQRGELNRVRRLGEAGQREVARVDTQHRRGPPVAERLLVVLGPGPVRGPHLDEARPGPPHDVGDADAATDLDELAPADDDAAPPREAHGEPRARPRSCS